MPRNRTSQKPAPPALEMDPVPFRQALLSWFARDGRHLPWRATTDPWHILVSEIMLQQTTVASVLANRRFEKFLSEFPDLQSIAIAPEEQILAAWEGLGYYNRVRNLQKTAQTVLEDLHGHFPKDAPDLQKLPGIGQYTAGAVSSFAFNRPFPIVDGNIARVLSRLFDDPTPIDTTAGAKLLWHRASFLLEEREPRKFNSALMELGQTHCRPKSPTCLTCPVQAFCQTRFPEALPVKKPRKKFLNTDEHALWFQRGNKLLLKKGDQSRRKGFYHLPLRSAEELAHLEPDTTLKYTITHHRVTLHLYETQNVPPAKDELWIPFHELKKLPISTPVRKIINQRVPAL